MLNTFLLILSAVFAFLGVRAALQNKFGRRFDGFFFLMMVLAGVCLIAPIRHVLFEQQLARAAGLLLDRSDVEVDCNSYLEGMFHLGPTGYVYRGSSRINLEIRTCRDLRGYLDHPEQASYRELWALHILSHEAMHVAGEFNEQLADCKAFQRNHVTAKLLGVAPQVAAQNAIEVHRNRPTHDSKYYSPHCRPGGSMDEHLPGAVWSTGR